MPATRQPPFHWSPAQGPAEASLGQMRRAFPRPDKAMGEAWFMGQERRIFLALRGDLATLSTEQLHDALGEIASGSIAFGRYDEWTDWYHYLLPRLVPRGHDGDGVLCSVLELLITAFFAQHPSTADEPYPGFYQDALHTLGRPLMDPACWPAGELDYARCLDKSHVQRVDRWFWEKVSGKLSSSLFFCLKYLPSDQVGDWLVSVLSIPSPHWRAQLMAWFVGAHGLLVGDMANPADLPDDGAPQVDWCWSHCITGNYPDREGNPATHAFISEANRSEAIKTVRAFLTPEVFNTWRASILPHGYLAAELAGIPDRFFELYASSGDVMSAPDAGRTR